MAALDGEKKKLIGQALPTFAIGALQAAAPGRRGKAMASHLIRHSRESGNPC